MLFNSLAFLYGFLPPTYFIFWKLQTKSTRYVWLTLTGFIFYAFWDYRFCALLLFCTVVSYVSGILMLVLPEGGYRRMVLVGTVGVNLAVLGFFKYANFSLEIASNIAGILRLPFIAPSLSVVLPIGISFYTFHGISYVIDCYRKIITPTRDFFELSCYMSLFSQLVAGPIVRFREIEEDLEKLGTVHRIGTLDRGWSFFAIGMIEKVLIADTIAKFINPALQNYHSLSTAGAWLCALGYTYQLYFDFSGYSNMAVGLGYLFGIRIPQNFNSPYRSVNPSDFWRRWHMSLSSFIRDYVYIPLGGNRGGSWFISRNIMITMLLGGLWHGANWTFILWGGYHGLLQVMHRTWPRQWDVMPLAIQRAVMFLLTMVGWVLFRSDNLSMAAEWLGRMFTWRGFEGISGFWALAPMLAIAALLAHFAPNSFELRHEWEWWQISIITILFLLCILVIYGGQQVPFLYFQF